MTRVEQHLVPHGELHVPPVGVELRLLPVLPLLQQRPHLRRDTPHQMGSSLARFHGGRRIGGIGRGEWAAGVLAAVGVQGRVAPPV